MGSALRIERALLAFPAAIALGLGVVYVLGAAYTAAQLTDAGLSGTTGLSVYSLEQILVRGMALLVQLEALFIELLAVAGIVVLLFVVRSGDEQPESEFQKQQRRDRDDRVRRRLLPMTFLLALIALVIDPAALVPFLPLLAVLGLLAWVVRAEEASGDTRVLVVVAALTGLIASLILLVFLNPRPLPALELRMEGGGVVPGSLVGQNDDSWFIQVQDRGGNMTAIPDRRVRSAEITPRETADDGKSLPSYIDDWLSGD